MDSKEKILIDHMFSMYNHLEDTDDPDTLKAVLYAVSEYNFDVDVLPDTMCNFVTEKLGDQLKEAYWECVASDRAEVPVVHY